MSKAIQQKTIQLLYFAMLKESCGKNSETIKTKVKTAQDLYLELNRRYKFNLRQNLLKVAINNEFRNWDSEIKDGDQVVFIPPVAGG